MISRFRTLWRITFQTISKNRLVRWLVKNSHDVSRSLTWTLGKQKVMVHFSNQYKRILSACTIYLKVKGWLHCHSYALLIFFSDLSAKEEERVWVKRQTDGELDDSRLTEGLTGESTVYKRRGMAKPEVGRPQIKCVTMCSSQQAKTLSKFDRPKRIRFLFDISASMSVYVVFWSLGLFSEFVCLGIASSMMVASREAWRQVNSFRARVWIRDSLGCQLLW